METTSEHIARDIREGNFPRKSEPQLVSEPDPKYIPPAYRPKNTDVPRAGELSSQVFNDLTTRIIGELSEACINQINDAMNRRRHAVLQMETLKNEIDKVFGEYEEMAKAQQSKIEKLAEAVRLKVEEDTKGMIELSNRLRAFADSMNNAHDEFFKDPNSI